MYADSIADVAVDKDLAPPHAVTQNVSPVPVYDYLPRTHGVSDAILGVPKTVTVGPSINIPKSFPGVP